MTESTVRLARTSDVDDVAAVQVAAWRQDFRGTLPDALLDALDPDDIALTWARGLLSSTDQRLYVALGADDRVVGYAAVGPNADPDCAPSVWEVLALEVDPEHRGAGHGSRLLHAVVEHAGAAGGEVVVTWTLAGDERRRAFFGSAGWGPDSAHRDLEVDVDTAVRQVRLATALIDA